MKCRDLDNIQLSTKGVRPVPPYNKIKSIIGFDTETESGRCFLIGYYNTDKDYHIIATENIIEILNFLYYRPFVNTFNFFYNINYDFQAIIKWLPYENLKELSRYDKTIYEDYYIEIIPGKMFSIAKNNKHKVKFFDLAQFFNFKSLDSVAKKHLNYEKIDLKDEGIDIKKLSYEKYKYNIEYRNILNKYLLRDIKLTKELGTKLYNMITPYINPKYFYSQASISQQYFLETVKEHMPLPPKKILDFALKSYQGGRFEIFKRGFFPDSCIMDIKSAYPFWNMQIPDISKNVWKTDTEFREDSLLSLFKIDTEIHDLEISPLKYQLKSSLMLYPIGKFKDIYVNKSELNLIKEMGFKYKIKKAFHYIDNDPTYPYKFLEKFYNEKEKYKSIGKKDLAWIPKIIINSFYGKSIQVNPYFEYSKKHLGDENLYDMIKYNDDLIYVYKKFKAGVLFNPIVANEITANTRVQLYNSIKNKEKHIIGFQTDSIIADKKLNLNYKDKLGSWEIENRGNLIVLGSGVYQMLGSNPKIRMRGFEKNLDLFNLLLKNPKAKNIITDITRNYKLKNTMRLKLNTKEKIELFNQILPDKRTININFDKKREWDRPFKNCRDVLWNQILSKPKVI